MLDLGQSLPLELLRGPLDLIESLALALELVDPLLGARDRISFVVLEDETDVGHGIFISFFGSLVAKQRANSTNLPCHSITGKWTGGKNFAGKIEEVKECHCENGKPLKVLAFDEARFGLINWHRRRYCPMGFRPPYVVKRAYKWTYL